MISFKHQTVESLLVALWNRHGVPIARLETVDIPLPNGGNVLYINLHEKIFTTWSMLDEMVRLSLITLVGKRVTKPFYGVQFQLAVNVRKTDYGDEYDLGVAKYGLYSDKLRCLEKRWRLFFNPLRRMPLEAMTTGRDFWLKTSNNWSFVMEELSAGVFRIIGTHAKGWRIDLTGDNPDRLMERIKIDALRMESENIQKQDLYLTSESDP